MATSRSPPGIERGLKSTAFTSVNTMVFKPMPSASVTMTAPENQRLEAIILTAYFKSRIMEVGTRFTLELFPTILFRSLQIRVDESCHVGFRQTAVQILSCRQVAVIRAR